jgi:hypothetical protein
LCLVIEAIGIGATLTVEESAAGRGPRVARWKPFSRADVEPPMRLSEDPVANPTAAPNALPASIMGVEQSMCE